MDKVAVNEWGEILCRCMNVPSWHGFDACDRSGALDDTLLYAQSTRPVFYKCARCGAIIEESTLNIVAVAG